MKKYLLIASAFLMSLGIYAQEETPKQFVPQKGDLGVVFNVAGLIANVSVEPVKNPMGNELILGKYFITDQHAFRLGIGVKSWNQKYNLVDSVGSYRRAYDSTYKKFNLYLSPGYEYHFKGIKRLDPYIGAGINLGFLGKTKEQIDVELTDTTGTDKIQTTYTQDGGFMFGVNALIGFNYFIAPKLSLGVEYNIGYYWARDGGDWERVTVETPVSGTGTSSRDIGSERSVNSGFDHSNNLSITVSYYFGLSNKDKQTFSQ